MEFLHKIKHQARRCPCVDREHKTKTFILGQGVVITAFTGRFWDKNQFVVETCGQALGHMAAVAATREIENHDYLGLMPQK